jgi:hypothetical protein
MPQGHGPEPRVLDLVLSQHLEYGSHEIFVHFGILADGGGGGNRTLFCLFRETAAIRDFRGQLDEGRGLRIQLVVPVSPQESPPVLPSRGEIVECGGTGFPTPAAAQAADLRKPRCRQPRGIGLAPTPRSPGATSGSYERGRRLRPVSASSTCRASLPRTAKAASGTRASSLGRCNRFLWVTMRPVTGSWT